MGSLDGRVVVVTGGNGALGAAVVAALRAEGATALVPGDVDLRDSEAVSRYYAEAGAAGLWGSVHVAGGFAMAPFLETSAEAWRGQLETNATTAFLCSREAARHMAAGGRIVNVAAHAGLDPAQGAGKIAYAVSKAAVVALTAAVAAELVPAGVLVNAVAPGTMDTPGNRAAMPGVDPSGWLKLDDVAREIVALSSPSSTANGRVLRLGS
ncbi:MAG: SDR family oxidoreductase [Deltaproteobacteria bacterium]|nr:SDR family oxidoreductase [Deltaproteobacteria bacterium]